MLLRTDPGPQVGRATRTFMDLYFHKPSGWGGQALAELGFVVRRTTTQPFHFLRMQLALDNVHPYLCLPGCSWLGCSWLLNND